MKAITIKRIPEDISRGDMLMCDALMTMFGIPKRYIEQMGTFGNNQDRGSDGAGTDYTVVPVTIRTELPA